MSKKVRQYIVLFLLGLFVTYYVDRSLLLHPHYVDGVWILHAHPFSDDTSHTHSCADYLHLDNATSFASTEIVLFTFVVKEVVVLLDWTSDIINNIYQNKVGTILNRGP